ncbi:hypothetical protein Bpfe_007717, partial [Biomphalaria pfeifferi]
MGSDKQRMGASVLISSVDFVTPASLFVPAGSEPPQAGGPQSSIVAPTQEEDEDTEKEEDIMGIKEETAEGLDEILDMELQ